MATADGQPSGAVGLARMRWWHIEQVMPIEAELFGVEQWTPAMFWNELHSGHTYLVALESGGTEDPDADRQVLGYAGLSLSAPDEAWVQNIAVRRSAQRRGIGRMLLEALLQHASEHRASRVLLEVAVDNAPAQQLYASYGFEPVGIRKGYYQPSNTDALVMLREEHP